MWILWYLVKAEFKLCFLYPAAHLSQHCWNLAHLRPLPLSLSLASIYNQAQKLLVYTHRYLWQKILLKWCMHGRCLVLIWGLWQDKQNMASTEKFLVISVRPSSVYTSQRGRIFLCSWARITEDKRKCREGSKDGISGGGKGLFVLVSSSMFGVVV